MIRIDLREHGKAQRVLLTESEADRLLEAAQYLTITRLPSGEHMVGPRAGLVGGLSLSDETCILVRPWLSVRSVLDLAALAYRSARLPAAVGDALLEEAGPTDWLALLLVTEASRLLASGIRSDYVRIHEAIPLVRGRIDFGAAARMSTRPGVLECDFDDYCADTPLNRILRGTLELLLQQSLHATVRMMVRDALRPLQGVTLVWPSHRAFDCVVLSRLTRQYEPCLRLCELFLAGSGVELADGDVRVAGFFLAMQDIFEKAVANALADVVPLTVRLHPSVSLPPAGTPAPSFTMVPDVVIGGVHPHLVIDTKYKHPFVTGPFGPALRNPDVYQIASYGAQFDCPGMLVYPRDHQDVDVRYMFNGRPLVLKTIDLTAPGLEGLWQFTRWVAHGAGDLFGIP